MHDSEQEHSGITGCRVTYESTIFYNEANKFSIIVVKTSDPRIPPQACSGRYYGDRMLRFTAVGYELPRTKAVELELDGEWVESKYGYQLQVEQWQEIVPQTADGLLAYLGSGLIKGIGPKTAEDIVATFGPDTLNILDNEPEKLLQIRGITEGKLKDIEESYAESRVLRNLMSLLGPFKITPATALKIYQNFGPACVDILKNCPYDLCQISGFGFKRVDGIVRKTDNRLHSAERIKGAVLYTLEDARGKSGHFHDCGKCDIIQLSSSNETAGKECAPMKGATSIQERLWELRKDKGLNLEELSKLTGISKSALGSYEKEDFKEINHGNLITLADFYGVSVDYLLCRTENREQINTPLTELHLNDEMVALLKSGRINNRLLCELATHKDFIKFLADIEIYVDGIATMQIQNLNALVDTVRHEIIERYRPGEDDPHLKVLQAAHISDDEYFSHMVLDDLNLIIRDIREAHKKDSESAPQTTVADELKENLEAVENFKGSRDEKLVVLYCKQLGINYKNLSDEEFRWLIRILKKSKKMGTPISQRKKR